MEEEAIAGGQWNRVKDCEKRFLPFARKFRFVKIEFETADGMRFLWGREAFIRPIIYYFFGTNLIFEDPVVFFSRVSSFTTFLLFFIYLSLSPQYINIDVDKKREERIEQSLRA